MAGGAASFHFPQQKGNTIMAHEFESGWVAHTAAWHMLADIKGERPKTWDEARAGYLDWEPESRPIYAKVPGTFQSSYEQIKGWNQIVRSDTGDTLSIQEDSYAVISNTEFGNVIEYIMGLDMRGMPGFEYETLSVLRKGRVIAVSLFMKEPFQIPGDPSATYGFFNAWTRHDGTGGMKGGPGTFRVVCANTMRASESVMDRNGFVFNIRHTANWADRMHDARRAIAASIGGIEAQKELAKEMIKLRLDRSEVQGFVERWLPMPAADAPDKSRTMVKAKRDAFWLAYNSETCDGITGTLYGVVEAAVEACDHYFPARSIETRTARIMLGEHPHKARALATARSWM